MPEVTRIENDTETSTNTSGAFYRCALASVSLPKAEYIGKYAFYDCSALSSISALNVQTIESFAFRSCDSLTEVTLPKATVLGSYAFHSCPALTSISLPLVERIGGQAFYSCSGLVSISLPLVESIGNQTFYGCSSLDYLTLGSTPPTLEGNVFTSAKPSEAIYVPAEAVDTYKNTTAEAWTAALKAKVTAAPM
jgi:hypothetical protein